MGFGPLLAALGIAGLLRVDADLTYWTDMFPAIVVFALGLVATVTPLTATVLADADESNAGIASGVNNAVARVASLLCVAALGAVVAAQFNARLDGLIGDRSSPAIAAARNETLADVPGVPAVREASEHAYHVGIGVAAAMVGLGGVLGLAGIRNPRREVKCADCPQGVHALNAPMARPEPARR
jgi:hypothetical protein